MQKPHPSDAYAQSLLERTRRLEKAPYTQVLAQRIEIRCQLQLALAREAGSTVFDHCSVKHLNGDLVVAAQTSEHSTSPHGPLRRNFALSFSNTRLARARLFLGIVFMGPTLFCNRVAKNLLRSIALEEALVIYASDPAASRCPSEHPPTVYARHLQLHLRAMAARAHGARVVAICTQRLDDTRAAGISYLQIEHSSFYDNNNRIEITARAAGPLALPSSRALYSRAIVHIFPKDRMILRWANRFSLAILGQERFAILLANRLVRSLALDEADALHRARLPLPPGVIAYSERISLSEMTRSAAAPAHKAHRL